MLNSAETGVSQNDLDVRRTSRTKKPKFIEDLGFCEKKEKKQKVSRKNSQKEHKEITCGRLKNCWKIFTEFKNNENYSKFTMFGKIEKSLKNFEVQNVAELAMQIRKVFNEYFLLNVNEPAVYTQTFNYSIYFENLYKELDAKIFSKESKSVLELKKKMNKLRRDMRMKSDSSLGRFKINLQGGHNLTSPRREKRISKKFKSELVTNIKKLTNDQIKGIIDLIYDSLDMTADKVMEIDINKLSPDKLKEVDKYVKRCQKGMGLSASNLTTPKSSSSVKPKFTFPSNKKSSDFNLSLNKNNNSYEADKIVSSFDANYNNKNIVGSPINLNINISNNFVVNNYKDEDSDLSLSDSLSSDSDSGNN